MIRNNQTGGRKNFCAIETGTIDQLVIENHRLTKYPMCIHQDDAKGCYDRIIRSHAILNSRKFGIPNNIWKVYSIAHDLIQFWTQIKNNISKKIYSSTVEFVCHGAGQGAGNGGTKWTFISIHMIVFVEEVSQGCIINLPQGSNQWKKTYVSFQGRQTTLCKLFTGSKKTKYTHCNGTFHKFMERTSTLRGRSSRN